MTPQEKANDLADRYYWVFGDGYLGDQHIQCALIAVDEILMHDPVLPIEGEWDYAEDIRLSAEFWKQVKQELLEKL